MEHLVRFTTAEGREGHHYADSLDAALSFVERLRNNEGAENGRVYRLHEVPIEFKAYYKVEVRPADGASATDTGPADAPAGDGIDTETSDISSAALPPVPPEPVTEAGGGRRLFARG